MKTTVAKLCLLIISLLVCTNLNAQHYDSVLKKLNSEYPQEKLYIQFDRSFYNPGETIWFKAYIFTGSFPSLISKTLYTELTDQKGKVLKSIISPVVMSSAAGSIDIPADINSKIIVRSYTKWMLNFDSSFIYTKAISIIPTQKITVKPSVSSTTKEELSTMTTSSTVLQFFPEGGDLVQGVKSRVAFKATDQNGIPVTVTGDITDSKGEKIISFSCIHDGMGLFMFQPANGERYKAVWKDQEGGVHETFLPAAKENGIVLETDYLENQIQIKIKRPVEEAAYPFVYVVAQMNQQELYRAKANTGKNAITTAVIPTENFPAGIVQVTVFTPAEKPIAERIVFVNIADHFFLTNLDATLNDAGKRKKNSIRIEVPDTLSCNLSVAITDADLDPSLKVDNIYSHLLLTDDIKGYVHDPAYYFSSDADSVAEHLDLVMMTNGWRRFKWEDLMGGHFPKLQYLPENYISIEGKVEGLGKKMLAGKEINYILETKNKRKEFLNIPVNPDGRFNIAGMIFYDTAKLFYQFNKDKKKTLTSSATFTIKNNLLETPPPLLSYHSLLSALERSDTIVITKIKDLYRQFLSESELYKFKKLKEVTVTTKLKTKQELMDEEYTSGYFSNDPSGNSRMVLPEDDPAFLASADLLSFLQNRFAGLQINMGITENAVTWRGFPTSLFVNEVPQTSISFDNPGKIVEDASYMLSLPMSDIAMVKIFNPPFFGAGSASYGGEGGAISVYLKKARLASQMTRGLDYSLVPGYSPVREFYSPDYSMPDHSNIPDFRSTLYWNPFVITDKNNRSIILSFYNNDITKKIKVIVEGCNENGKLTRVEKIL